MNDAATVIGVKGITDPELWREAEDALREAGFSRSDRRKGIAIFRKLLLPYGGAAGPEPREEDTAADMVASLERAAERIRASQ